ncbi:MAG: hypothetical protein E7456_02355 [Ruminococcaceae bacterium]|nr:hypothetical protein [Oscillospiraceae bacterium]
MITPYEKQLTVLLCRSNAAKKMGPVEAFGLFQDIATEHSRFMNADYDSMMSCNAFWAITKTRIHFNREPEFFENITVKSWPNAPTSFTGNRNYIIIGEDGQPAVTAVAEWVLMDTTTRRLRRFNSTCYPLDAEHCPEKLFEAPYRRFQCEFGEDDFAYSHIIRASDTDIAGHTNNTVYCRLMLDAFPASFFRKNAIRDFEVRYAIESREGETLSIYRKTEGNIHYLAVKNSEGKVMVTALLETA